MTNQVYINKKSFKVSNCYIEELIIFGFTSIEIISKTIYGFVAKIKKNNEPYICVKVSSKQQITSDLILTYDNPHEEYKYISLLKHPNIIEGVDMKETEIGIYLFTHFYEYSDLYSCIRNKYIFSKKEIYVIMKQLTDAVLYIDSKDCIYTDLSPENIIIESKGSADNPHDWKVRLIDMGSVIFKDKFEEIVGKTHISNYPGKLSYRPPEFKLYKDKKKHFEYLEIYVYTLGIIMYNMLTNTAIYYEPTYIDIWYKIVITGEWITDTFTTVNTSPNLVYLNYSYKTILFINNCIKYPEKRIKMEDFNNQIIKMYNSTK